jgi:NDP-sugar pyrophosphorylase family protein
MNVLIPTSGTGSRLCHFTKYTNKSLVKVGDRYAICHIIESYPEDTRFVITLGYYGNHVKDFLDLAYPTKQIEYVWVDLYEGEGSSLGYSILKASHLLQCPFVFHCCDTINMEPIRACTNNTLYVSKNDDSKSYATICTTNVTISAVQEKGATNFDYIYNGIAYIHDYTIFWSTLNKLYADNLYNQSLSDIHVYQSMVHTHRFNFHVLDKVYDTGNLTSYSNLQDYFPSSYSILDKSNESLCFFKDRVIKFINDKDINTKRVLRGKSLGELAPTILESRDNFILMRFVNGTILSEYKGYGELSRLLNWAQTHVWIHPITDERFMESCHNFYYKKTIDRISKLPDLDSEKMIVNSINVGSILSLLDKIEYTQLYTSTFTQFHGDFILDNIIREPNGSYKLLDWRHEFDKEIYSGDCYYDLAKLHHNIIFNHKNIVNNLYTIEEDKDTIYVDLKCNYMLMRQLNDYTKFIQENKYNEYKIKVLTALIWLNMAPLYEGSLRTFLFYFGKFNLYLAIQEARP